MTVESLTRQGNDWFLTGDNNKAFLCYYKALHQAKALTIVLRYIRRYKENLSENQEMLRTLLREKYHISLVPGAITVLLLNLKQQVDQREEQKAYQRFKVAILSQHPETPEQYVDALLEQFEFVSWQHLGFLSDLLLEHGFNYYVCDVDRLYHERSKTLELTRFERSLQEKKTNKTL